MGQVNLSPDRAADPVVDLAAVRGPHTWLSNSRWETSRPDKRTSAPVERRSIGARRDVQPFFHGPVAVELKLSAPDSDQAIDDLVTEDLPQLR